MAVRLLLAASAFLLVGLAGCSGGGGATTEVGIHGFAFDPASVTISSDESVTFVNHESTVHTATADGGAFDSGNLDEGEEYEVELPAGSYPYHCTLHPNMRGTIVVS